jgi:hypothetical protein
LLHVLKLEFRDHYARARGKHRPTYNIERLALALGIEQPAELLWPKALMQT